MSESPVAMRLRGCGHPTRGGCSNCSRCFACCKCGRHRQEFGLSPEAQKIADAQCGSEHISVEWLYQFAAKIEATVETRWQAAIYERCKKALGPELDYLIDGGGCESGDALDFSLAEIGQAIGFWQDKAEESADKS